MNPPIPFFLSRLCVSSLLWRDRPIEDAARALMDLGLAQIELAAAPLAPLHYQPGGNNSRIFNHLAEAGVAVAALRLTGMTHTEKLRAIEEAGERRIPLVIDRAEPLNYPDLIDRIRTYAWCAAQARAQLVIENDAYTSCDGAAAQLTIGRALVHPALSFALAPPHALAGGFDPADEVRALGDGLRVAYLWDASPRMAAGAMREEFDLGPPEDQTPGGGEGSVDWAGYFQALAETRFRGLFLLNWEGGGAWDDERAATAIREAAAFCLGVARGIGLDW